MKLKSNAAEIYRRAIHNGVELFNQKFLNFLEQFQGMEIRLCVSTDQENGKYFSDEVRGEGGVLQHPSHHLHYFYFEEKLPCRCPNNSSKEPLEPDKDGICQRCKPLNEDAFIFDSLREKYGLPEKLRL